MLASRNGRRRRSGRIAPGAVAAALCLATAGDAQTVVLPAGIAPGSAIGYGSVGGSFTGVDSGHPLPTAGKQEVLGLVTGNAAAAPATIYGGDYVFTQSCTGYGSISLRVRGPDGATMQPVLVRTAADTGGGAGVSLGTNAVVDAVTAGTTGCNATLSRVP